MNRAAPAHIPTMFANQVSIKDLFASSNVGFHNGMRQDGYGDGENSSSGQSNSQYMYSQSQMDFGDSQDAFGSQSSQKENGSPGKFYQRYMPNRGQCINRDMGQKCPPMNQAKSLYQHQMNANKVKMKDRDERDLLSNILNVVRECSLEVKEVASAMKETVTSGTSSNTEALSAALVKVDERLTKNREDFLSAIGTKRESNEEIATLKEKLKECEKTIAELKEENTKLTEANQERMVNHFETVCKEHADKIETSLKQLYEAHHTELVKQTTSIGDHHKKLLKSQEDAAKKNTSSLQKMEDRIGKELQKGHKNMVKECEKLQSNDNSEVVGLHQQHIDLINQLVQKQAIKDEAEYKFKGDLQELRLCFQEEAKALIERCGNNRQLVIEERSQKREYQVENGENEQSLAIDMHKPLTGSPGAVVPMSPSLDACEPLDFSCSTKTSVSNTYSCGNTVTVHRTPVNTFSKTWTTRTIIGRPSPSALLAEVRAQSHSDQYTREPHITADHLEQTGNARGQFGTTQEFTDMQEPVVRQTKAKRGRPRTKNIQADNGKKVKKSTGKAKDKNSKNHAPAKKKAAEVEDENPTVITESSSGRYSLRRRPDHTMTQTQERLIQHSQAPPYIMPQTTTTHTDAFDAAIAIPQPARSTMSSTYGQIPTGPTKGSTYGQIPTGPTMSSTYGQIPTGPTKGSTYGQIPTGPTKGSTYGQIPTGPTKGSTYGQIPTGPTKGSTYGQIPTGPTKGSTYGQSLTRQPTQLNSAYDQVRTVQSGGATQNSNWRQSVGVYDNGSIRNAQPQVRMARSLPPPARPPSQRGFDVFDFDDDIHNSPTFWGYSLNKHQSPYSGGRFCSPPDSESDSDMNSQLSSPSLSVSEVVIQRRIRTVPNGNPTLNKMESEIHEESCTMDKRAFYTTTSTRRMIGNTSSYQVGYGEMDQSLGAANTNPTRHRKRKR